MMEKHEKRYYNRRRWEAYHQGEKFWKRGDALTEKDRELLLPVIKAYEALGHSPSKKEVPDASALKERFRVWRDVLTAAGLPSMNSPENQGQKR